MQFRLGGKRWRFLWESPADGSDGECQGPHVKNKTIWVKPGMPKLRELETVIHECLHALDWDKDEEWVHQSGEDLARVLGRLYNWERRA